MPFEKINVNKVISDALAADSELKQAWDESRTEYNVLGNLIKLRKEKGLSQAELAGLSGNKQQVILCQKNMLIDNLLRPQQRRL